MALGSAAAQTIRAFQEAEAWHGPSLIIAYSTCIAHGIDMTKSNVAPEEGRAERLLATVSIQSCGGTRWPEAVHSSIPGLPAYLSGSLGRGRPICNAGRTNPERSERLLQLAQADINVRWRFYEQNGRCCPQRPEAGVTNVSHRFEHDISGNPVRTPVSRRPVRSRNGWRSERGWRPRGVAHSSCRRCFRADRAR